MDLLVLLLLLHTRLSSLADFTSAVSVPEVFRFILLLIPVEILTLDVVIMLRICKRCLQITAKFERAVQEQNTLL